ASQLYLGLRNSGWGGLFAYSQADDDTFRNAVPFSALAGILATTTWPFTASDAVSSAFRDSFIGAYGEIPGPIEAATYALVNLLAAAINRPGELQSNLSQLDNIRGVQGLLHPAQLPRGETSNNAAVVQLGEFGAPQVEARFEGNQEISGAQPTQQPGPIAT